LLLSQIYAIALGNTHFAITFSIYLNSRNLKFFRSTPRNTLVYFVGPIAILSTWFLIGFLGLDTRTPSSSASFPELWCAAALQAIRVKADSMNAARFNSDNPFTQFGVGVAVLLLPSSPAALDGWAAPDGGQPVRSVRQGPAAADAVEPWTRLRTIRRSSDRTGGR
jgi:hypothetical protein